MKRSSWPSQHGGLTHPISASSVTLTSWRTLFQSEYENNKQPDGQRTCRIFQWHLLLKVEPEWPVSTQISSFKRCFGHLTSKNEEPGDFGVKGQEVRRFYPFLSIAIRLYYCILIFTHYRGGFRSVMQDWSLVPPPLCSLSPSALALCLGGSSPGRAQ